MKLKLWLLVLMAIGAYLAFVWRQHGQPSLEEVQAMNRSEIILALTQSAQNLPTDPHQANQQLQTAAQRAQSINTEVQKVLGDTIQTKNASGGAEKSLQQKAIDHGLYLYCQGVVEQYEQTNQ